VILVLACPRSPGTGLLPSVLPAPGPAGEPGGRSRATLEEEGFQTGKELAALDEHQIRRWTSRTTGPSSPCSPTPSCPS
jgi:hypothetical protein